MYIVDTNIYFKGRKIISTDTILNSILIIIFVVIIAFILIFILIRRKPIVFNNLALSNISYTSVGMVCDETIKCLDGYICAETSVGNMCLAEIGTPCGNLLECVNTATVCDGRCIIETGGLGSLCETTQCQGNYVCTLVDGKKRCLIPQGSSGCTSYQDCVPNSTCNNGICESGLPPYSICTDSNECSGNNICLAGRCQPSDISIVGSAGSYCDIEVDDCAENYQCQFSEVYNLPQNIGYCVRPISVPFQTCTRFIGCLPVSQCVYADSDDLSLGSVCGFKGPINNCLNENCSPGFTCQTETQICQSDNNISCSVDSNCSNGLFCASKGINSITFSNTNNLYQWQSVFSNVSDIGNLQTLSLSEQYDSANAATNTTFCIYDQETYDFLIIYPNNMIQRTTATFEFPSPNFTFSSWKNIKLFNGNIISFHISIQNSGSQPYDIIILRNLQDISFPSTLISLSIQECTPVQGTEPNIITYYTFDYNGNYLYVIIQEYNVFSIGPYFSTSPIASQKLYSTNPPNKIYNVIPYTNIYIAGYNVNSVMIMGYNVSSAQNPGQLDGFYLYNIYSQEIFPVNVLLNSVNNEPPQIGINMSLTNNISNFKFFYYNLEEIYLQNVVPGVGISTLNVPGYVSAYFSNIVQSSINPDIVYILTPTCS